MSDDINDNETYNSSKIKEKKKEKQKFLSKKI